MNKNLAFQNRQHAHTHIRYKRWVCKNCFLYKTVHDNEFQIPTISKHIKMIFFPYFVLHNKHKQLQQKQLEIELILRYNSFHSDVDS